MHRPSATTLYEASAMASVGAIHNPGGSRSNCGDGRMPVANFRWDAATTGLTSAPLSANRSGADQSDDRNASQIFAGKPPCAVERETTAQDVGRDD